MGPRSHTVNKWQSQKELWLWLGYMTTSGPITLSRWLGLCAHLEARDHQLQLKDQLSQKRRVVLPEKGRWYGDRQKQHISTGFRVCVCGCMHMHVCKYKISKSHSSHHSSIVPCHPSASSETWVLVLSLTSSNCSILNRSRIKMCKMRLLKCLLSTVRDCVFYSCTQNTHPHI